MNRRRFATLFAAAAVFACCGANAFAQTVAVPPYSDPAYLLPGYYYCNPYIAPFPGYGILPPPFATMQMLYGHDWENRKPAPAARTTRQVNYQAPTPVEVDRFRFEIAVPTENAVVLLNGVLTKQKGLNRVYVTPPLVADKRYTYTVEVQWMDGSTRTEKMSFDFLLGESTRRLQFPLKTK